MHHDQWISSPGWNFKGLWGEYCFNCLFNVLTLLCTYLLICCISLNLYAFNRHSNYLKGVYFCIYGHLDWVHVYGTLHVQNCQLGSLNIHNCQLDSPNESTVLLHHYKNHLGMPYHTIKTQILCHYKNHLGVLYYTIETQFRCHYKNHFGYALSYHKNTNFVPL